MKAWVFRHALGGYVLRVLEHEVSDTFHCETLQEVADLIEKDFPGHSVTWDIGAI